MYNLKQVIEKIEKEYEFATNKFKKHNSLHESYAVLKEEVDELWDEIKKQDPSEGCVEKEAIQVATMAIRLIIDCIEK